MVLGISSSCTDHRSIFANFVYADLTTSKIDIANPQSWVITHFLFEYSHWAILILVVAPLLTISAYLAHHKRSVEVQNYGMDEYILKRVDRLNSNDFIFPYIKQIYLQRDADAKARELLHTIATDYNLSTQHTFGICIIGRPTQGKTRLVWEVMQAELSSWTFVMWPHDQQTPFKFANQRGKRIVLWLDDIHKFANPAKAAALCDVPRLFTNMDIPLVVVATCRDGEEEIQARKHLGNLFERLTEIRLTDISEQEASKLLDQTKAASSNTTAERYRDTNCTV